MPQSRESRTPPPAQLLRDRLEDLNLTLIDMLTLLTPAQSRGLVIRASVDKATAPRPAMAWIEVLSRPAQNSPASLNDYEIARSGKVIGSRLRS